MIGFPIQRFNVLTHHAGDALSLIKVRQTAALAAPVALRETADESIRREMPLKIRLTPMSVPIAQPELTGQRAQIRIPSTKSSDHLRLGG